MTVKKAKAMREVLNVLAAEIEAAADHQIGFRWGNRKIPVRDAHRKVMRSLAKELRERVSAGRGGTASSAAALRTSSVAPAVPTTGRLSRTAFGAAVPYDDQSRANAASFASPPSAPRPPKASPRARRGGKKEKLGGSKGRAGTRDALEAALAYVEERDPRKATEEYDRIADAFYQETMLWPPGRDRPAEMGDFDRERSSAAWRPFCNRWHERRSDEVRAVLVRALALSTPRSDK